MRTIDPRGKVHVAARIPAGLAQEFERLASQSGRSISAELRQLIEYRVEAERRARGASNAR
jgi:predicted DNA-binding protein